MSTAGPLPTPDSPATPVPYAVDAADPLSTPVSEDLIRGCVTPWKVQGIQKALEKERVRHMCALKLLPFFFTKEEVTKSNTDGSHRKERLDATKLNSLFKFYFSVRFLLTFQWKRRNCSEMLRVGLIQSAPLKNLLIQRGKIKKK